MVALLVLNGRMVGELRDRFVSLFDDRVRKLGAKDTLTLTDTCVQPQQHHATTAPFSYYGPTIGEFWNM